MPEASDVEGEPAATSAVHDGNTAATVPKVSVADAPGEDRTVFEYAGGRHEPRIVRGTQGAPALDQHPSQGAPGGKCRCPMPAR
jgi:hypothetical protein